MSKSPSFSSQPFAIRRDHGIVEQWWRASGIEPLPWNAMPRHGIWAVSEGDYHAGAFCYLTMSDLAILAFAIARPGLPKAKQAAATAYAIEAVAEMMRMTVPGTVLLSLCHDLSMHQTYVKRAGFRDTGRVHLGVLSPPGMNVDILTE